MTTLLALAMAGQLLGGETVTFHVGYVDRTALVFRPDKAAKDPPVLFMFHGHGGGSRQAAIQWRYEKSWPEAVVVYPQGLPGWKGKTDPEGTKAGWQGAPGQLDDRDLKFVDAMLVWAKKEFGATPSRTFVTGHSNGSLFTWVVQAERGDKFAGFAGACAPGGLWFRNAPVKPMFVLAGKDDQLVPFRSMELFTRFAVRRNDCGDPTVRDDGTQVYSGTAPLWVWDYDGGHRPPSDAGARVVEFFKSLMKS
ncbi:MAG TPA: hypothetical protein VNI20_01155 [Fimbriimonadaceae bacterium]|nr:hypothetical protein [Fimbriimonadaceae bacterium]